MTDKLVKESKSTKVEAKRLPSVNKKTITKIGSLPKGYTSTDVVYITDNKIFIAKASAKK